MTGDIYIGMLIGAILFLCVLFYMYMTSQYSYWKDRKVPYLEPKFPFGNIKDQLMNLTDIGQCFKTLYDQMPGERYFGIFELGKPTLVLRDLELIKAIMVTDFYNFSDRGHIHEDVKKDFLAAQHLFNLKNEEWKLMRAKILPTFTSGRMKRMYELMFKCSKTLDNYLETIVQSGKNVVDFKDLMLRFTSDTISSCLFGLETNAIVEEDSEVRKISRLAFPTSLWTMVKLMLSINQPYLYDFLGLEINHRRVKKFCMQVAKDTYNYRVQHNIYRDDFVDLLIKIKQNKNLYEDEKENNKAQRKSSGLDDGLTFEEMAAQVFVMFAAGFETSSTTSSLALYEMAKQPDILAKATKEVEEVLKNHGGIITYQALKEMVFLEQILFETLRLYPSLPLLTRKCVKTYKVPDGTGLIIEKGTRVVIPSFAINRDPNYYPDPLKFLPDRYHPKKSRETVHLHFGDGPMACIGMRFGKMQVKCALATILHSYHLSVVPDTPKYITLNPCQFLPTPMEAIYLGISKKTKITNYSV